MNRDPFTEIARARSALDSLDPSTDRETWVRLAMSAKAAGLDFDDFHNWSAGAGNYKSEAECRSVWNSTKESGGITAATIFKAARDSGWSDSTEPPPKRTQSRQVEGKAPEPDKAPLHDPATLWNACKPVAASHEYINRKLGLPDGLRVYHGNLTIAGQACDGSLVLPCRSLSGDLATLQFIPPGPDAKKLFLPGAKLPSDACLIVGGPVRDDRPVYICEGIGQAWSAHQGTTAPAAVCFGVGRMQGIAKALRERHKAARLVLVADAGKENQCAAIAKDIHGAWVEMPKGSASNYDLNDFHKEHDLKAVAALLEQVKEQPQRFKLLTPADLANLPPVQWRIKGVLPTEGITADFGPSGSAKSFLVIDKLAAVAGGREWFGCRVTQCPVLYVALEGEAGISQRVKAWQCKNGKLPESFRFMLQSLDIRITADRADLVEAVKAAGYHGGILAIDTLNRAAPGMDENDSKSMGEVITAAKAIQAALGGLVLLVHHTGKDATKGLRGHSSLHAALDAAIEVSRDGDRREWRMAKSKDGEDGEAHPFRLEVVEIGTDEDGEPITSCVVVPEESTGDAVHRALPPKSGNQRVIWDALGSVLKASSSYCQGGAAPTRPCVRLEDAIEKIRTRLVCDPKRQTERTRAAITGLVNRGLIEHQEGWLWIA
ncbi:MAG: AAA family ATPase [Propionivibrio sp.]|uniref:AAA family ATPase n=1 Tax=Candidatus Propionivibrio dominans TaxID=2954373 RepID=A0A9D7F7R2_9RHOO|nr:AAA family ATPase [Candidatus Propionivibrio dominans]